MAFRDDDGDRTSSEFRPIAPAPDIDTVYVLVSEGDCVEDQNNAARNPGGRDGLQFDGASRSGDGSSACISRRWSVSGVHDAHRRLDRRSVGFPHRPLRQQARVRHPKPLHRPSRMSVGTGAGRRARERQACTFKRSKPRGRSLRRAFDLHSAATVLIRQRGLRGTPPRHHARQLRPLRGDRTRISPGGSPSLANRPSARYLHTHIPDDRPGKDSCGR